MTISTDLARVVHVGNGATTLFSFAGMEQVTEDNVAVTLVATDGTEAPQVLGADYTISPSGVTFAVAPANGVRVVIQRIEPLVQPDRYITNAPFPAAVTEQRLDRMVMGLQQIADAADRGVRASIGDTADLLLPSAAARANLLLGFDAQGNVIAVRGPAAGDVLITPFGESLVAAADAPAGRTVLGLGGLATLNQVGTPEIAATALNPWGHDIGVAKASPMVALDATGATHSVAILRLARNGTVRWDVGATGDAAQNWLLNRFNDAGVYQDTPLTIDRATGRATFAHQPQVPAGGATAMHTWHGFNLADGVSAVLPAGGTWAWFLFAINASGNVANANVGLHAGGTTVLLGSSGWRFRGFAWRYV